MGVNAVGDRHGWMGRLDEVNADGLVLFGQEYLLWNKAEPTPYEAQEGEYRWVSRFYPWHSVHFLRLQEEEEQRDFENLRQSPS